MNKAEQNYRLLREIEANRLFLLMAYRQNPKLLESAETRIKQLFEIPAHGVDSNLSSISCPPSSERGISLIELIMFIVIVSVALAGILLVMNVTTKGSADPLIHKQALAIAESLLEEVELMPFTICDPDDGSAASAVVAADCGTVAPAIGAEVQGVENDVSRYDSTWPFDNVSDYHGFAMSGGAIYDITDGTTPIPGLSGYKLKPITVAPIDMPPITIASGDALLITVTVTGPDGVDVAVEGIRTRYAPRTTP